MNENQKVLLLAEVRSMIILLNDRVGEDENPYRDIELDKLDIRDLATLKRNLHEVLYAPPPRAR